jgi:hypothetical protein
MECGWYCGPSSNCMELLPQDVRPTGKDDGVKSYLSEETYRPACDQNESILSSLVRSALVPILPNSVSKSVQDAGEAGVAVYSDMCACTATRCEKTNRLICRTQLHDRGGGYGPHQGHARSLSNGAGQQKEIKLSKTYLLANPARSVLLTCTR